MNNLYLIPSAMAQSAAPSGGTQGLLGMFVPMAVVFAIFYFLIIRPQRKRDKDHQGVISKLEKGDEVVTQSGLFGKISGITDKVVTLEISPNVKIKVLKNTVLQKVDSSFMQQTNA